MKVTAVKGYAIIELLLAKYPNLAIIPSDTDYLGLMSVSLGKNDAMIIDLSMASYIIDKFGINNLQVTVNTNEIIDLGFASRIDKPILNSILEKGLQMISQPERSTIHKKWIHIEIIPFYKKALFWKIILGISLVAISINSAFIFSNRFLKKEVDRKTKDLQFSLEEKNVLLKEIHHRVKNNMEIISSLINLQIPQLSNKSDKELYHQSQRRISALALVHEKLYESTYLSKIEIKSYLNDLISQLTIGFNIDKLKINNISHNITIDMEKAVPCGLIVTELLTNSFKHAFVKKTEGSISCGIYKENRTNVIEVSDDGYGIDISVFTPESKTLGIKLVHILTKQIDDKIEIQTEKGTSIKIRFP